ncbi:MAG: hypothetical protein RIS94_2191 [Pseudomonadota bacterium]|jgi:hypothetical protein
MSKCEGGCLCGSVRYTLEGDPLMVGICHCRHCQKQSGAPFSVVAGVAEAALSLNGETRTFHDRGDSGSVVERIFCPTCGSPLVSRIDAMPGLAFIKAGTLDAPAALVPTFETYCDRRWPFLPDLAAEQHPLAIGGAA